MSHLQVNKFYQALLDGKQGKAKQFAMQTIVTAANIDHAESLIDINFSHTEMGLVSR